MSGGWGGDGGGGGGGDFGREECFHGLFMGGGMPVGGGMPSPFPDREGWDLLVHKCTCVAILTLVVV